MTSKVGPKGQVVVPKRVREEVGLRPGDEVVVESEDSEVRIRRVARPTRLLGMLADSQHDLLADLESDHRWEIERDEVRAQEGTAGNGGSA